MDVYGEEFKNNKPEEKGIFKYPNGVYKGEYKMIKEKAKEFINMQMWVFMKVNLKIIKENF